MPQILLCCGETSTAQTVLGHGKRRASRRQNKAVML